MITLALVLFGLKGLEWLMEDVLEPWVARCLLEARLRELYREKTP